MMQKREEMKEQALSGFNYERLKNKEKADKQREKLTEESFTPKTHKYTKSRKERRKEAREKGEEFVPQYNSATKFDPESGTYTVGGEPKTYEEMYGVGYERFNDRYVKFGTGEN
jgi:hypothetical protein